MIKANLVFQLLLPAILISNTLPAQSKVKEESFKVSLQKRPPSVEEQGAFIISHEVQHWLPSQTAIIICDMWDKHWCTGATQRVGEMAPYINEVIATGRKKGILIVHAPSDCMDYYKEILQK